MLETHYTCICIIVQNVSDCYPIFIPPDGYIRFHPIVNPALTDINVTLIIRAWDNSSGETACTSGNVDSK